MEQNLHYLLLTTHMTFERKVLSKLSGSGLSPGQPKILDYLEFHNGCVQKELASACKIEPATVTNLLARMEGANLIERKALNGDRRSLCVYLTKEGKEAQALVSKAFSELEEMSFKGFSEQEQEELLAMLMKIYQNISPEN